MTLPLLLSVPHAGLRIPPEIRSDCILSEQDIREDGDEGAAEIYDLADAVAVCLTTDVARAIVDLNRAEDDHRKDGVIKTHTCWDVPVYRHPLPESVVGDLLEHYYRPYHARLSECPRDIRLRIDCHTMAAVGPPVGPDPGAERPWVCLSNGDGTCPDEWIRRLADCFRQTMGDKVRINDPFTGGFICRSHAPEGPWVQLELSRAPFLSPAEKRDRVWAALKLWNDF